jgi:hypothetical protein
VIPWTLENGGTSHDPAGQAFVLAADGTVEARAPDAAVHQPAAFADWLREQADHFERRHPRTKVPFVRASVVAEGEGDERTVRCPDLERAREEGTSALLYFGREDRSDDSRGDSTQAKAARKFERTVLDSESAAEAAKGWVLLRFDLSDPDDARLALSLGIAKAPTLALVLPGAEGPEIPATAGLTGAGLAALLKKRGPAGK